MGGKQQDFNTLLIGKQTAMLPVWNVPSSVECECAVQFSAV
jgi:hypothetical protein